MKGVAALLAQAVAPAADIGIGSSAESLDPTLVCVLNLRDSMTDIPREETRKRMSLMTRGCDDGQTRETPHSGPIRAVEGIDFGFAAFA